MVQYYFANFDTKNGYVFVVCDGMGGHAGGEKASRIAIKAIKKYIGDNIHDDPSRLLINSMYYANREIIDYSLHHPELKGMGSTCVILLQNGTQYYYAHVGDSRLYYLSGTELIRLTKDHSFVQSLIDMGALSEIDAANHPRKNEITNALGIENMKPPTVSKTPLQPKVGDCLLLCTDGLYGLVCDDIIKTVLHTNKSLTEQADELVRLANNAGGFDNITVQIVKVGGNSVSTLKNIRKPVIGRNIITIFLSILLLLLMVIAIELYSYTFAPSNNLLTNNHQSFRLQFNFQDSAIKSIIIDKNHVDISKLKNGQIPDIPFNNNHEIKIITVNNKVIIATFALINNKIFYLNKFVVNNNLKKNANQYEDNVHITINDTDNECKVVFSDN